MKTQFGTLKNLRFSEQNDTLIVTGRPQHIASIPAGHRLVYVDNGHYISLHQGTLYCDGTAITTISGNVVNVHRVGTLLIVATSQGIVYLSGNGDSYTPISPLAALPAITISQQTAQAITAQVPAIAFAEAYDRWQAPLAQADITALTAALRNAWNGATAQAQSQEVYYGPLKVRYGVRLWDDSYLWVSNPVTLGTSQLSNAPNLTLTVDVDNSKFIGVPSTTFSLTTFTLGITVTGGIAQQWRSMVKAVDILVTKQIEPIQSTASIFYRCLTSSAPRTAILNYGFNARSQSQATAQLAQSQWTVVASCTDLESLSQGQWVPISVPDAITLSNEQCDAATLPHDREVVASLVYNGRLYIADKTGLMTTSRPANALVVERECVVTGARLLGLAPVPRSLYSGGFGRYPVYLFTDEGIFAIPLTTQGTYGEPRLLDRTILNPSCTPVEGNRDIYFVSSRGNLCLLRASNVTIIKQCVTMLHMAWDDVHHELWSIDTDGTAYALSSDKQLIQRTINATHLYDNISQALAITLSGEVLDLTSESMAMMDVEMLTQPDTAPQPLRKIMWQVYGDDVNLQLDLLGERGESCHGFLVNRMSVTGRVAAPIHVPVFAPPLRTVRRHITGSASTGSRIVINE